MCFSRLCSRFQGFQRPKMASGQLGLLAVFGRRISRASWAAQVFLKICFLAGKSRLTQLPYRTDSLMLILIFTGHLSRVAPSTLSVRVCCLHLRVSFSPSLCTLRQEPIERSLCYKYIYIFCMIIVIHVQYTVHHPAIVVMLRVIISSFQRQRPYSEAMEGRKGRRRKESPAMPKTSTSPVPPPQAMKPFDVNKQYLESCHCWKGIDELLLT